MYGREEEERVSICSKIGLLILPKHRESPESCYNTQPPEYRRRSQLISHVNIIGRKHLLRSLCVPSSLEESRPS